MLLEKINELEDSSFSFRLYQIHSCSVSMHDVYEIIFVLKGSIDLKCTAFHYHLTAGDIFIVNVKELHKFSNGSDDNLILIFHFNPYLYLHIFPKLNFHLFVCNSFASEKKDNPKLLALQQMLLHLAVLICKKEPSAHKIHEQVLSIITYLINNFQSFYVKQQGYHNNTLLENNDYQLQRICEIQEYLYVNAKNKIRLEDLANYLHLSKYYVSHLIKNGIGLSMTDFLSLTRVEQSEVLLLSSDLSIEQIAFECGFSARRYYEKHFFKWFGMTPSAYRKTYLNGVPEVWTELDLSYIQTEPAKAVIHPYMYRETAFSLSDTFFNFKLRMAAPAVPFSHKWEHTINISNPYSCAIFLTAELIEETKKDLNYQAVRIKNIFTSKTIEDFHPEQLNGLLDSLAKISVDLIICISVPRDHQFESFYHAFQLFFQYMKSRHRMDFVNQWQVEVESSSSKYPHNEEIQDSFIRKLDSIKQLLPNTIFIVAESETTPVYYSHNSMLLTSYIIQNCLMNRLGIVSQYRELYQSGPESGDGTTEPYPSSCLLTDQFEKRPIYYVWQMMSSLGNEQIVQQPGLVATREGSSCYILLYDPNSEISTNPKKQPLTMHLVLSDLQKSYIVIEHYLDSAHCLFQHRSALKFPANQPKEVLDSINQATAPTVNFQLIDTQETTVTLNYKLNPHSVILLSLIEVG